MKTKQLLKVIISCLCKLTYISIVLAVKVLVELILSDSDDAEKKTRNISEYDYPGSDPMYDGEYVDWQGVTYTKDLSGAWNSEYGVKYDG